MANDKDKVFEMIYRLWKGEGEKRNQSIDFYCERNGVKVEDFRRWYQGISKAVKEVQVTGRPGEAEQSKPENETAKEEAEPRIIVTTSDAGRKPKENTIAITLNTSSGLHITRRGMSYDEFLTLAQNLKALC